MPITTYVAVNVLLQGAAPPAAGFGTPVFVTETAILSPARLLGPYSSLQELVDAGFLVTDPAYLWAQSVLQQQPRPAQFWIGRRDAADANLTVALNAIEAAGPGDFYLVAMESRDPDEIVQLAAWVESRAKIAGVQSSAAAFASGDASTPQVLTITVGGTATDGDYDVVLTNTQTNVVVADVTVTRAGAVPVDNDAIAAEIQAELDTDLDTLAVVTVLANVVTVTFAASQAGVEFSADLTAPAPGTMTAGGTEPVQNIGQMLEDAGYHRTFLSYYEDDGDYVGDGAWPGRCLAFDLDADNGAGTWHGKSLAGVTGSNITEAQRAAILEVNGNVYAPVVYSSGVEQPAFTSMGTMASGRFIDVTTTLDWVHARSEEALLGVTLNTPTKNAYTDAGLAKYQAAELGVLARGVAAAHFVEEVSPVTGRRTPWVDVPRARDVPQADKDTRRIRLTGEVIIAGAVHIVVNFTLYANT